ncbi:MAG TPA: DUF448 domain-containing protein [Alphaproteobacteria bacterium]|nr:DUF448 domain-containing protein [Alphaproteobacteria bacterium]
MEAAQTPAPDKQASAERRCLVTGEVLPKADLIRFVVSPDNTIVPDLAQDLPGRGLWVSASNDAITKAAKGNLFSKAAKASVKVDADLVAQVAQLMHKRCLTFLGLARRSGIAVLGQAQVEGELKAGKLGMLLIADDAGSDMGAFKAARGLAMSHRFSRNELGAALGHDQLVYVALKPHALTEKLQAELARLEKIATPHYIEAKNG